MGASQSVSQNSGPRSIPIRPRTPLRFGSVPTPQPVNPAEYNTRPIRHLYANRADANPLTALLSQEHYFYPSPLPNTYPTYERASSVSSSASTSTGSSQAPTGPKFICSHPKCVYNAVGFTTLNELDAHMCSAMHFTGAIESDFGWNSPPRDEQAYMQHMNALRKQQMQLEAVQQQSASCSCPDCYGYAGSPSVYDYGSPTYAPQTVQLPLPPTSMSYQPQAGTMSWKQQVVDGFHIKAEEGYIGTPVPSQSFGYV